MPTARRSLRTLTPAKAAINTDSAETADATQPTIVPTSSSSSTTYATTTPARQRRKRMTEAEQLLSASDAGESDIEQHMHADHALTRSHHKHLHSHSKLDTIAEDSDGSQHNTRLHHLSVPTPATTTKGRSRLSSKKLEPISEASQSEDDSQPHMSRTERLAAREARRKRTSVDRKSLSKQATPPATPSQKLQISVDEESAHNDNKTGTPHADQFLANLTSEFTTAAEGDSDDAEQSQSDVQSDEDMQIADAEVQSQAEDAESGSEDAVEDELIDDDEPVSGSDLEESETDATTKSQPASKSIADLLSRAEAMPQSAAHPSDDDELSDDSDAEPEAESFTATKQHVVDDEAARQQQLSSQRTKADERREQKAKIIRQRQEAAEVKQRQVAEAKVSRRGKVSAAVATNDVKVAETDDDLLPDEVLEAVDKLESERATNNIAGGSKVERAMRKLANNQLNDDSDDDDDIGIDDLMAASKQLKQHKRKARRGKKKGKGMRIDPTIVKSKRSFDDLYEYTRPAEGGVTVAVQPSYQNDQRLFIDDYLSTQVAYVPPKILQHQYRVQYNDSIRRAPPKKKFKQLIGRPNAQFVVR